MNLNFARRYDEALALLLDILRDAPNNLQVLGTLKTTYHLKGMYEEALDIWRKSFALKGDQEALEALERGYEEGGYSGALSSVAEKMIERSRTTFVTPWQIATLYTRAEKNEEALIWLEKAYEAYDPNMRYIGIDPIFDDLIDNPRFQDLLRKINLPQAK